MEKISFVTGDVFLFEHDDSCVSRLICKLSNSPISHAAMYFEDGLIIEEGLPHIGTRPITKLGNRAVHVRRYRQSGKSSSALLAVARKHLEAEEPYSMGNLVAVGVLLVFNSWKPDARWAVKQALSALCILIAKAIDKKKLRGKKGATCSQLVYEIYDEAGFTLTINRKNDFLNDFACGDSSLLQLALDAAESGELVMNDQSTETANAGGHFDLDKMCCVLLSLLGEPDAYANDADNAYAPASDINTPDNNDPEALDADLYEEIVRFASLLQDADTPDDAGFAEVNDLGGMAKRALQHLLDNYSGFVSPGQLYTDCPDLAEEITVIHPGKD